MMEDPGRGIFSSLLSLVQGCLGAPPSAFLRKNTQSKRQRERNWGGGGRRVVSQEIHYRGKDGKLKERSKE